MSSLEKPARSVERVRVPVWLKDFGYHSGGVQTLYLYADGALEYRRAGRASQSLAAGAAEDTAMIRDRLPCVYGGWIEAHWQVFDHATCDAPQQPEPPRLEPKEQLARLQLQRVTQAVKSLQGRWQSGRQHRHRRH